MIAAMRPLSDSSLRRRLRDDVLVCRIRYRLRNLRLVLVDLIGMAVVIDKSRERKDMFQLFDSVISRVACDFSPFNLN